MAIRRIRAAAAATVLALSLGLTACSSDDDATTGPSGASTSSPTDGTKAASMAATDVPTECTDPLANAKPGDVIDGREFAFCQAEALAKLEGYLLTRVTVDYDSQEFTTTNRVQVDPLVVEIDAPQISGGAARVVVIEGKAYVKLPTDREYAEVPEDTTDKELAYFAKLPSIWEKTFDPKLAAEETEPGLTYTVVRTDKVDDVDVTVLESRTIDGTAASKKIVYVDSRFLTLTSVFTVTRSSEPDKVVLEISSFMSEINAPQQITDPRSAN